MSKETNPDEPFFGAVNFRLLNFCGVWILSNSIFSDISHLILDEHPCQMNACICPPSPEKKELRSTKYQLSQVIKGQIALYIVSHSDMKFLFHTITAHISKINKIPLPTCNSIIIVRIECNLFIPLVMSQCNDPHMNVQNEPGVAIVNCSH